MSKYIDLSFLSHAILALETYFSKICNKVN